PMGGCLPLLIQLPIIFILYQIVYRPLTYMIQMAPDAIEKLKVAHNLHDYSAEIKIAAMEKTIDIDFNFLGLDLSQTPNFNQIHWLWLIPVLAGITTYALSWMTNRQAEARKTEEQKRKYAENPTANSMQTMTKIMPLITVWFAFSFPAGIGFYWIMNNVFKMIQQFAVNKILSKEDPLVVEKTAVKRRKRNKF
ncbi:MAG: membrane protein insertase YidC, partial [Clostridia bacterium]|nr:membrane protein insertase YidC [Clostridia bacterium]